nr:hypothetical protein [Tanacetum cinerariifolium]
MLEEERESLSIKERSRLLAEFINKRKKMIAKKRAEEKRNKPPTQAQQRTYMSTYLKNIRGYTLKQLKQYSFKEIKMLFDNTMESIRRFVLIEKEGQGGKGSSKEESSKKVGGRFKRKTSKAREDKDKRQKKQDDPEKLTLMKYVKVIYDSEEGDMKTMFEPNGDDEVWKNHHSQELIEWKLYYSCGVYSLMLGEVSIHMLVKKKYTLPQDTLRGMI